LEHHLEDGRILEGRTIGLFVTPDGNDVAGQRRQIDGAARRGVARGEEILRSPLAATSSVTSFMNSCWNGVFRSS